MIFTENNLKVLTNLIKIIIKKTLKNRRNKGTIHNLSSGTKFIIGICTNCGNYHYLGLAGIKILDSN